MLSSIIIPSGTVPGDSAREVFEKSCRKASVSENKIDAVQQQVMEDDLLNSAIW